MPPLPAMGTGTAASNGVRPSVPQQRSTASANSTAARPARSAAHDNAFGAGPLVGDRSGPVRNSMTIDVEDYYQVQAFAGCVSRHDWNNLPSRVERNTDRLLALFDRAGTAATFFVLGCVAQRHPDMVRRIVAAGHEIASHGWEHILVHNQTPEAFAADIRKTKALLEDLVGSEVTGYRAATFSIGKRTPWAFEVLAAEGYRYSSSIYPVRHDLYGMPDAPRTPFRPNDGALWEIPMTTLRLMDRNLPCSGGGYFRLIPYWLFRQALARVNRTERLRGIFYLHPWEIDPGQPRIDAASRLSKFRHYVNLEKTEARLSRLLRDFAWDRMDRVYADILATPGTVSLSHDTAGDPAPV